MRRPVVTVCTVTHDDGADLAGCLDAVAALETRPLIVVVADCASADDSVERARAFAETAPAGVEVRVVTLDENRGFAGGMNAALGVSRDEPPEASEWVLTLNADARPAPDYVERLLEAAREEEGRGLAVGAVTGRLIRWREDSGNRDERILDACGMVVTPAWRHHDRGSDEIDRDQHRRRARVFGATGAASLFRRRALEDVALDREDGEGPREIFDERFHSFREDAELAFRLRERGWEVLYEPRAACLHRRVNLPARRSGMPAMVNYHSLKNRYLLRASHQTLWNALWTAPWTKARDLAALLYVLVRERSSLSAYRWLWQNRRQIVARRRAIQSRRTVPPREIDRWFRIRAIDLPSAPRPEGATGDKPRSHTCGAGPEK